MHHLFNRAVTELCIRTAYLLGLFILQNKQFLCYGRDYGRYLSSTVMQCFFYEICMSNVLSFPRGPNWNRTCASDSRTLVVGFMADNVAAFESILRKKYFE